MKILVTNIHLNAPHGSEEWVSTITNGLKDLGHDVYAHAPGYGPFHKREMSDIPYVSAEGLVGRHFDLILLVHPSRLINNLEQTSWDKLFVMCFGRLKNAEMPIRIPNASYFCISEEIKMQYRNQFDFFVMKQPFSQAWFDIPPCADKLKHVVWAHHNKNVPDFNGLQAALERHGITFTKIGTKNGPQSLMWPEDIRKHYAAAQLIIGFGRWVYQAMAAGRPAVIANRRILGAVTPENYKTFDCFNMTDRHPLMREISWDVILDQWSSETGNRLKDIAVEHHHIDKVIHRLMEGIYA